MDRKGKIAVGLAAVFGLLACGCQKQEALPRAEFPLTEEAVESAVELSDLDWSIERTDESVIEEPTQSTPRITYSLTLPDGKVDFAEVFVTSYQSERFGRFMEVIRHWNKDRIADFQGEFSWEDCRELLELSARLYGGFQSDDEIFKACSAAPLPTDERTLWQGQLTGGYCLIEAIRPIQTWEEPKGGGNIYVTIYETESAFEQMQEYREQIKEQIQKDSQ